MTSERTVEVAHPKVFPQCTNCEFAQRAAKVGPVRFPQATTITLGCEPSGGGGMMTREEDNKFVEYQSRIITVTPNIVDKNMEYERLEGNITTCPVDIADSPKKYPRHPHLEQVGKDMFGRGFRYEVPTASLE